MYSFSKKFIDLPCKEIIWKALLRQDLKDSWNAKQESYTVVWHLLFFQRTKDLWRHFQTGLFLKKKFVPLSPHPRKFIFSASGLYSCFPLHPINTNVFSCFKDTSALLAYWLSWSLLYSWSLARALVCSSSFSISDAYPHLGLWDWACSYCRMRGRPGSLTWETPQLAAGFFIIIVWLGICVMHLWMMCVGTCAMECMWRSEDSHVESFLLLHLCMSSGTKTRVCRHAQQESLPTDLRCQPRVICS